MHPGLLDLKFDRDGARDGKFRSLECVASVGLGDGGVGGVRPPPPPSATVTAASRTGALSSNRLR
jgi:hypothetical protein